MLVTLWPRIPIATLHEDEGVVTMYALQVLAGHAPYRDFAVGLSPVIVYLYAGAFEVFGSSLLVDRLMVAMPISASTVLVAILARRLLPAVWSAAVAVLWGVWLPAFIGYGAYHFWGPAFIFAMTLALSAPRPRLYLAGAMGALALLFYQGLAPAVLAGLAAAYLARRRWSDPAAMAAPLLVAALALGAFLAVTGTFGSFLDQAVVFPTGRYQAFNRLPIPWNPLLLGDTLNWHSGEAAYWEFPMFWLLGIAAPTVVSVFALVAALTALRSGTGLTPVRLLAVVSTGLFASAFVARVGGPICWLAAPAALVLVAYRLRQLTATPVRALRVLALSPIVLLWLAGLSPAPVGWRLSCTTNPGGLLSAVATPAGRVCLRRPEAAQLEVVQRSVAATGGTGVAFLPTSPGVHQLTATTPEIPSTWTLPRHTRATEIAWTETAMLRRVGYAIYIPDPELDTGHPWQFDSFLDTNYELVDTELGVRVYRRRGVDRIAASGGTRSGCRSAAG